MVASSSKPSPTTAGRRAGLFRMRQPPKHMIAMQFRMPPGFSLKLADAILLPWLDGVGGGPDVSDDPAIAMKGRHRPKTAFDVLHVPALLYHTSALPFGVGPGADSPARASDAAACKPSRPQWLIRPARPVRDRRAAPAPGLSIASVRPHEAGRRQAPRRWFWQKRRLRQWNRSSGKSSLWPAQSSVEQCSHLATSASLSVGATLVGRLGDLLPVGPVDTMSGKSGNSTTDFF